MLVAALIVSYVTITGQLTGWKAVTANTTAQPASGPVEDITGMSVAVGPNVKGSAAARLAVVEFSDFQCPYCGEFARNTFPKIQQNYVDSGRLKYMFVHDPLEQIHTLARRAAVAADCAAEQGRFWELHDRLFANQSALSDIDLERDAEASGVRVGDFRSCLSRKGSDLNVSAGVAAAKVLRIAGTPTLFVGELSQDGRQVKLFKRINGALPYDFVRKVLEEALSTHRG